MSEKRKAPLAPEGARENKRRPPIIELTATEIRSDADDSSASRSSSETDPDPPPTKEAPASEHHMASARATRTLNGVGIVVAAAAILGTVVGFVLAIMLWSRGTPQIAPGANDVGAQIPDLQRQITNLHNRLTANDSADVDTLMMRVAKIENAVIALQKTNSVDLGQRLNTIEKTTNSLGVAFDALNRRDDSLAEQIRHLREQADAAEKTASQLRNSVRQAEQSTSAVAPNIQQHIAALEQSVKDANTDRAKFAAAEKSIQLALSANTLRTAVISGLPYQDELKQAKSLTHDEKILAPLEPFAATGLLKQGTLANELRDLIPVIKKVIRNEIPTDGFLERLQANFSKLVRITPINTPSVDSTAGLLTRLDKAASNDDIAAALNEVMNLPESARVPAQTWIKKVQERQAALAATQSFAASSTRHLGSTE
jgi:hypothetical protein